MDALGAAIARDGFAFVHAREMRELLTGAGSLDDWTAFADSWNRLELDRYMADGGRYRRRRHAIYAAAVDGGIVRAPHQPHYQSRDYNALNGGVARWFEPVTEASAAHPAMRAILTTCHRLFDALTPEPTRPPVWHVEVHQFRIEAAPEHEGLPTPEGMHRDG